MQCQTGQHRMTAWRDAPSTKKRVSRCFTTNLQGTLPALVPQAPTLPQQKRAARFEASKHGKVNKEQHGQFHCSFSPEGLEGAWLRTAMLMLKHYRNPFCHPYSLSIAPYYQLDCDSFIQGPTGDWSLLSHPPTRTPCAAIQNLPGLGVQGVGVSMLGVAAISLPSASVRGRGREKAGPWRGSMLRPVIGWYSITPPAPLSLTHFLIIFSRRTVTQRRVPKSQFLPRTVSGTA